jgi:hypothetical protein
MQESDGALLHTDGQHPLGALLLFQQPSPALQNSEPLRAVLRRSNLGQTNRTTLTRALMRSSCCAM